MIIEGQPELGLQKHQQDAYKSVRKAYKTRDKASVVIPTGCGKSFIALQLMVDNKDKRILFMAPTNAIRNQMYNYIANYIVGEEPTNKRTTRIIAEEEKERYREKYPKLDEVLETIRTIDMQYGNDKQRKLAILIKQDLEKRQTLQEAKK